MDIVETDYDNFAVLYSCKVEDFGTSTRQRTWVLSRQPTALGSELHNDILRVFKESLMTAFAEHDVVKELTNSKHSSIKK